MSRLFFTLIYIISITFAGCTDNETRSTKAHHVNRSFYYWKSVFQLNDNEIETLNKLSVKTLYVKYFDVAWDPVTSKPIPVATLRIPDADVLYALQSSIIPTIFITNETMLNVNEEMLNTLAQNILNLIAELNQVHNIKVTKQIQIDCDWNASSQQRYFELLKKLKQLDSSWVYSATIRLHQLKYANETGVPPVDRGLLMCYNMGNIKNVRTRNSILDPDEMKLYTNGLDEYTLPLDVAFPLFSWTVLFRNNQYAGLLQNIEAKDLDEVANQQDENRYTILDDILIKGYALQKGDQLRFEESRFEDILKAAKLLKNKFSNDSLSVSLYHLDPLILNKFSLHELEAIYNSMH